MDPASACAANMGSVAPPTDMTPSKASLRSVPLTIMGRAEPPRSMKCRLAPDPSLTPTLSRRARERTRCANFIVSLAPALRLLLSLGVLVAHPAGGIDVAGGPSIRLPGAHLDAVQRLAVEAGRRHGWSVIETNRGAAVFEKIASGPGPQPGAGITTLVRVRADFIRAGTDTLVQLRAEQIDALDARRQGTTDVTERYRDNLMRALRSLRARWQGRARTAPPPNEPTRPSPSDHQPRLGTWAYYAERHAQERGCRLAEQGAVLLSANNETELHRVHCQSGRTIRVSCQHGECRAAP